MTNLADRLRAHATGFVHAHATERLLIEAAEALTPPPDHADLIGRLEAIAKSPDAKAVLLVRWNEPTGDPDWTPFGASETLSSKLLEAVAAIRSLTASLSRVEGDSKLLRGIMANIPDTITLTDHTPRVAYLHPVTGEPSEVPAEWYDRLKDSLMAVLLRAREQWRQMGHSFGDEGHGLSRAADAESNDG